MYNARVEELVAARRKKPGAKSAARAGSELTWFLRDGRDELGAAKTEAVPEA